MEFGLNLSWGRKMTFTLAAHLWFAQVMLSLVQEDCRSDADGAARFTSHPRLSDQRKWKWFLYPPVGFGSVKLCGWNTYVNPARQHKPRLGLTGSLQTARKIWGIWNALRTVRGLMPLVGSSHAGARSERAFTGMSGCLAGAEARGMSRRSELNRKYPCSFSDIFDKMR